VLHRNPDKLLASLCRPKACSGWFASKELIVSLIRHHSFRRFSVTHLRKQGTPEDLLRFWIGHGDKTVTDWYAKLCEDVAFRKSQTERVGIGFSLEVVPCCPRNFDEEQLPQVVVM
jgi:hypothetical protein